MQLADSRQITHVLLTDADLEFSDTEQGEVTNSDQQVLYINHGGGAVSTIRRSFAIPFTPHVSSYPTSLYDNQGSSGPGPAPIDAGFGSPGPVDTPFAPPEDQLNGPASGGISERAGGVDQGFQRRSNAPNGGHEINVDHTPSNPSSDGLNHRSHVGQDDRLYNPVSDLSRIHFPDPKRTDSPVTNNKRFNNNEVSVTTSSPFDREPPPPPPIGLPVPPTSYGVNGDLGAVFPDIERTRPLSLNSRDRSSIRVTSDTGHGDRVTSTSENSGHTSGRNLESDHQFNNPVTGNVNHNNNNNNNININNNNNNNNINPLGGAVPVNPLSPLFQPIANPFVQPDFFSFFDTPFGPPGVTGGNNRVNNAPVTGTGIENLFQRRRLTVNNVPDISNNAIGGAGYPSYNFYKGNEEDLAKWPKIFKFTDGRINLNDFEKDKKLGRIKFTKPDPLFDDVRRDSFLILHGGTYS